jgi:hypothetical protein
MSVVRSLKSLTSSGSSLWYPHSQSKKQKGAIKMQQMFFSIFSSFKKKKSAVGTPHCEISSGDPTLRNQQWGLHVVNEVVEGMLRFCLFFFIGVTL